jgi:hypothetical protein
LECEGHAFVIFLNFVFRGGASASMAKHAKLSSGIIYLISVLIAMMLELVLMSGFALICL